MPFGVHSGSTRAPRSALTPLAALTALADSALALLAALAPSAGSAGGAEGFHEFLDLGIGDFEVVPDFGIHEDAERSAAPLTHHGAAGAALTALAALSALTDSTLSTLARLLGDEVIVIHGRLGEGDASADDGQGQDGEGVFGCEFHALVPSLDCPFLVLFWERALIED